MQALLSCVNRWWSDVKCECCSVISGYYATDPWRYRNYSLGCAYCGARRIQVIQRKEQGGRDTKADKCRKTLSEWTRYGHSEQEIRALAKTQAWAIERKGAK